jgi:acyl-CoA synthetase (AMP-forming)/AMP-acid ligase II
VRWPVRDVPRELRERYLADGWWRADTLGDVVERSLRGFPSATVTIWSDTRPWHGTYAGVHEEALQLAAALRSAGFAPGDPVAFQLPNWREAVVAFYGLAIGGFVLVPIVHIYGSKEVRFILAESGARVYVSADGFGHVDYLEIVDGASTGELPDLALHVVVTDAGDPRPRAAAERVRRVAWDDFVGAPTVVAPAAVATVTPPVEPDDVCVLAYTSGTTSAPKGVIHTHRTLCAEIRHIRPWITPGAPNLMGSPVTHATGMLGAVLAPMELGEDIHLIDRWDPTRVLDVMLAADVGAGTGASVFLASVIDHPSFTPEHARRIRRVGLGGAPVPQALAERAAAHGIELVRAYGSTEHPSISGGSFDDPAERRHATDGRPLPGVEVRLVDGEIWSRGPDLCMGYTDPALTARAFTPDGWYRTGDVGVLDDGGYLRITDRLHDVIIRGGENISAAEVEELLATLPEVAEVAVVAAPDARLGEHGCAVVRPVAGAGAGDVELRTLTEHLARAGLARQKWPEELRVVTDFPRTAAGKIRKVELRQWLRDGTL